MSQRRATALVLGAIALVAAACGDDSGDDISTMPRVADLLTQVDCDPEPRQVEGDDGLLYDEGIWDEPEWFAAETGSCRDVAGHSVTFSVYPTNEARDNALEIAEGGGALVVFGDRWYAFTSHPDAAEAVMDILGGELQ